MNVYAPFFPPSHTHTHTHTAQEALEHGDIESAAALRALAAQEFSLGGQDRTSDIQGLFFLFFFVLAMKKTRATYN